MRRRNWALFIVVTLRRVNFGIVGYQYKEIILRIGSTEVFEVEVRRAKIKAGRDLWMFRRY